MPSILKIDGLYNLPNDILDKTNRDRFDFIYNTGLWARSTGGESRSGSGSTIANTELYRKQLVGFLEVFSGRKLRYFDAPCGDLNWMLEMGFDLVNYIGGDISTSLVKKISEEHPHLDIRVFDIINDSFPDCDIWHCRHCLFHLSLEDIYTALCNFLKSDVSLAIITSHFLPDHITFDIDTGGFRFLDLRNYPFYFPQPKQWLLDTHPLSGSCAMASGVWTRNDIEIAISNYEVNLFS